MRRVVVTGIGMINALGLNREDSFKAIVDGRCGVKTISSFDVSEFPVKIAAEITDFDPSSVMDAKEVKKADRFIQLGIKAAKEAMEDSGLLNNAGELLDSINAERFGISSASGIGGLGNIEKNSVINFERRLQWAPSTPRTSRARKTQVFLPSPTRTVTALLSVP